ncbi:MAG: hypothetical protein C4547_11960 [Phycisphaerales bacterium]|nr:MAG: hypothetical protein C4547_11960 [Phycisphaerales bacterium]
MADTIYVDDDSTCSSSCGGSWATAYPDLQAALAVVSDGDTIRVAQGTYRPTSCEECDEDDRAETFDLVDGVVMEGGYAADPVEPDLRDPSVYETILSGDIDTTSNNDSYHVVTGAAGIESDTILDGFTIKKGRADGGSAERRRGAGIYLTGYAAGNPPTPSASPTIRNCTIEYNLADAPTQAYQALGGGVFCDQLSTAAFESCTLQNNQAFNQGGAVATDHAAPSFTDCRFISNEAAGGIDEDDGFGGAVSIGTQAGFDVDIEFLRCTFRHNTAVQNGGALYTNDSTVGDLVMTNCLLYRNGAGTGTTSAEGKGGAVYTTRLTYLTNCTFAQNTARDADSGGGIYHNVDSENDSAMDNCILWKNTADGDDTHEADQIVAADADLIVLNTCIQELDPNGPFADPSNIDTDPLFSSLANDNYVLLSTGCDIPPCASDAIDAGNNDKIACNQGDIVLNDRCVDLEGGGEVNDMGCYETQE